MEYEKEVKPSKRQTEKAKRKPLLPLVGLAVKRGQSIECYYAGAWEWQPPSVTAPQRDHRKGRGLGGIRKKSSTSLIVMLTVCPGTLITSFNNCFVCSIILFP